MSDPANPPARAGQEEMDAAIVGADEPPRRVTVDANDPNVLIQDAKKPQVPQETEKKLKVMSFIARAHYSILVHFGGLVHVKNLSVGDQIHNVLFTSYNVLRQRHNQTGGTLETRIGGTEYKIILNGSEVSKARADIHKMVEKEAADAGIPFGKYGPKDPNNWYGIAGPLFNFLGGFGLRRKELRLGHGVMPVERRDRTEKVVNLHQYGIYGVHHVLCEGVTFPPEKRSSMAQTVGPLTALLCFLKSERKYSEKWLIACKRAMAHFPDIDSVLSVMREKDPTEIRSLVTLLADIALIVSTRQANRMFPPPAAFSYIFTRAEHKVGNSTYTAENIAKSFNFSGHGAFVFYKVFQSTPWTINLNKATDNVAKQIVYHSMFGTYKEDLSILAKITNLASWLTREEMGNVFQKANTEGNLVQFIPVQQVYYSKMAQANQTGLLTSSYSQMTSQPVFSGQTKRKYSDAFFDHLASGTSKATGGKSLQALVASYSAVKEDLRIMLEKGGRALSMGTTGWRKISDATPTLEGDEDKELVIEGTGRFFLGRND